MLDINEMKKESESMYVVIKVNESATLTFLNDGVKKVQTSKKGKDYIMREFKVNTFDNKEKILSLFSRDGWRLIEILAKHKGVPTSELTTLENVKVEVSKILNNDNKEVMDFKIIV